MEAIAWVIGVGVALYLLFTFTRQALILIGILVLAAGGVWAWFYAQEQLKQRALASVRIEAVYDPDLCGSEYPIWVSIRNNNRETLTQTGFYLEGYRSGFSNALYRSRYSTDRIIEPSDAYMSCWRVSDSAYGVSDALLDQHPPERVEWRPRVSDVDFR